MATDFSAVLANLLAFYDFNDKTMISVGAAGGQLPRYGCVVRKVSATGQRAADAISLVRHERKGVPLDVRMPA